MNNLSKISLLAVLIFMSCSEFIEPSVENKSVTLLAPANATETNQYGQTFWWGGVEDAFRYRLQVVSPTFDRSERLILDTVVELTRFNHTLDPGSYQWRVRAENGSSQTPYTTASFVIHPSTITEQQVQLVSPVNNTLTNQANATFKWLRLYGAEQYELQIDTNAFADEAVLFLDKSIPGLEYTVTFARDKTYQWRVRAKNATVNSKWSAVQTITYDKQPPPQVILSAPTDNQTVSSPVTLRWQAAATAKNYQLYVYKSDGKSPYSTKYPVTVNATSYVFSEGLTGEEVVWEVRAIDEVGNAGAFSELRGFFIQ